MCKDCFIATIQGFPCLWDVSNPYHKNQVRTENAWKAVATISGTSVKECQVFWRSLKDEYLHEKTLAKKMPYKSWKLLELMGFLERHNQIRSTTENVVIKKTSLSTDNNAEPSIEDSDTDSDSTNKTADTNFILGREENEQHINKKRKAESNVNQLVQTCLNIGQSLTALIDESKSVPKVKDEDYYFGLCLAKYLSKIKSTKKKLLLKAKIFEMLAEEMDD